MPSKKISPQPQVNVRQQLINNLQRQLDEQKMLNAIDTLIDSGNSIFLMLDPKTGKISLLENVTCGVGLSVQKDPTTILADISNFILSNKE